ncbi:zona pellucida sperm-binding protein 3 [Onychostruthus taczanowskii]|uniref:zona pellucida sperm-binding protein 3 n=1 Tax=Onychostruthus taczanowskii TaxID=356909 RepID=UPI001B80301E|nr:zona pellucida sperm-binding protein 3 [Onychostruthus taczanowskii]
MRSQIRLLLALLCAAPAAPAPPPWEPAWSDPNPWVWGDEQPHSRSHSRPQMPVEVQCQEAQLVVTVHRDLFGTGRLVSAAELSLGPAACKHSRLDPSQKTVTFSAGLHECGSTVQVTPDSLIYRTLLSYDPSPGSNPAIVRSDPAVIPIECHYPRRDNVSSGSIRPTWAPFNSALASQEKLLFSLRLMNEDWSSERDLSAFRLGDVLNIQAEVGAHSHVPLRLFVDSCVATLGPGAGSEPHYAIIDFNGCLVDGRSDATSSAFVTPRPRQDVLRFQIDAFRFAGDSRSLIYITCHLKVTPAEQSPDALNKACSFSKARNTWAPVEGTRDICSCCERGNCGQRGPRPVEPWNGHRYRRHDGDGATSEADVVIGPVLLSSAQRGQRPEGHQGAVTPLAVGTALACAVAGVAVAGAALAIGLRRRNSP